MRKYICEMCDEGSTSSLHGICDDCARAIAQERKRAKEASEQK